MTGAASSGTGVVITGVGLVTSLGLSAAETWNNVKAGNSGMGVMSALEQRPAGGDKPGGNGGQAPDLPAEWMPGKPREVRYLRRAVEEALNQSGVTGRGVDPARCACVLGTTLHGMRQGGRYLRSGDHGQLCSFLASATLDGALRDLPVRGLRTTTCSACSSGLGAIALGVTLLRAGVVDVVIAGGYDPVSEYAYAGFDSMRLVEPGKLRPFCRGREGMKLAEGYAIVVLERAGSSGVALAQIRGVGESADAHHLTQPHPEGEGAFRAIEDSLAGMDRGEIGLISAHATATVNNDAAEHAAFSRAFGKGLADIPAVAFKSHVGHTLGAAGGTELILSLMALREGVAPPTCGVSRADLEFPAMGVLEVARPCRIRATLNTSLGFGGANTCIVLGEASRTGQSIAPPRRDVFITGLGFLAPGMIGAGALATRLKGGTSSPPTGMLDESEYAHLINARRVRRMSEYSKLTLAATAMALEDAGISDVPAFAESCSVLLGTTHGGAMFCRDYYTQVVREGMAAANPVLFAEGVPNAASAQLSLMLEIKGSCQTIIGSRTAGLDALGLAALRISTGASERIIVGAAEEDADILAAAYRQGGDGSQSSPGLVSPYAAAGFQTSCGAVCLILESAQSVGDRRIRGTLEGYSSASAARGELGDSVSRVLQAVGEPGHVMSSANGTWIDREEARGIDASARRRGGPVHVARAVRVTNEMFSVGALAAIAGALECRAFPSGEGALIRAGRVASLASDFTGVASGIVVSMA